MTLLTNDSCRVDTNYADPGYELQTYDENDPRNEYDPERSIISKNASLSKKEYISEEDIADNRDYIDQHLKLWEASYRKDLTAKARSIAIRGALGLL